MALIRRRRLKPEAEMDSLAKRYTNPSSNDVHFEQYFQNRPKSAMYLAPLPHRAHFVYVNGKPLSWLNYVAIRAAIVNLNCTTIRIWTPIGVALEGEIWQRVQKMIEVEIEAIEMPQTAFGRAIKTAEQSSELVRLKVLYEEGGIYMENDLVALRSSDAIINAVDVRATIMAERLHPSGVPNWMIMSKPRSPYLIRYMEAYTTGRDWAALALNTALESKEQGDLDLTVLHGHSWFYPLASAMDGDTSLKKLWFGKTWHDIDLSYGTHVWHWKDTFRQSITPHVIRNIDTPLFCRIRHLFDNMDGDGYVAQDWHRDAACQVITVPDLATSNHRLFADYQISNDEVDMKLQDSSGFSLHAWAPNGTNLIGTATDRSRQFTEGSYFVSPVPAGWDARIWTVRARLQLTETPSRKGMGFFKVRTAQQEELLVSFFPGKTVGAPRMMLAWKPEIAESASVYQNQSAFTWASTKGLSGIQEGVHELAISFDRRDTGEVAIYLDGSPIERFNATTIPRPSIGQELWFNARDWRELDTDLRANLHRLTFYADALSVSDIDSSIIPGAPVRKLDTPYRALSIPGRRTRGLASSSHQLSLLSTLLIIAVFVFAFRQRKSAMRWAEKLSKT